MQLMTAEALGTLRSTLPLLWLRRPVSFLLIRLSPLQIFTNPPRDDVCWGDVCENRGTPKYFQGRTVCPLAVLTAWGKRAPRNSVADPLSCVVLFLWILFRPFVCLPPPQVRGARAAVSTYIHMRVSLVWPGDLLVLRLLWTQGKREFI
jgi:hypothetical protein